MPKISNDLIIEIRNKVDIVDVISEYLPLTQKGKNYFALCPFHDDHTPSMSISPEKQIYTCFVCGASGNVFTFLMEYEHLNFIEAVKLMANKVGVSLPISDYIKFKKNDQYENLYKIYDLSNKFYQNYLNTANGKDAKEYLYQRNFTDEIINEFQIGLAPFNNKVSNLLQKNKFSITEITESGICNFNNDELKDIFVNRIMFPLWNLSGQVIGFSGRIYSELDTAKYINSKESKLFKKGELLYNYHRAKDEARRQKKVIIVEGFMDVLALYKHGVKNVVATMGTAITHEQALLIKKLASQIILCFDGDEAGAKATINCGNELSNINVIPQVIRLSDNFDPDDYIEKKGINAFLKQIEEPVSFINYKIEYLKKEKNFNDPNAISLYIDEVIKELSNINDTVVRELLLQKISAETNVSIETLTNILNKEINKKPKINNKKPEVKKSVKRLNKYEQAEQRMLYYMLHYKEVIKIYKNHNCYFPNQIARYLASEIVQYYDKYKNIEIADYLSYLGDKEELVNLTTKIMALQLPEEYLEDEINDYIKVLDEFTINLELNNLEEQFKKETDIELKTEIATKIIEIKKGVDISD